jgi:hypothetical protein
MVEFFLMFSTILRPSPGPKFDLGRGLPVTIRDEIGMPF